MESALTIKERLRARARALGFDACRMTSAQPPDHVAEFQRWLAAERHGEMAYLARNAHKRIAPEAVLAEAKSVIVVAASYYAREESIAEGGKEHSTFNIQHPTSNGLSAAGDGVNPKSKAGMVARYARFTDYHEVLGERLRALTEGVNAAGDADTRSLWYVDTGPFLERDLAQRAGLGFVGKHTNLISREFGNWIFLAEIITTLELPPDPPEKNRCGSCSRCLEACPTRAFTGPFALDARRCISYLTIESKGPIPVEFRPAIGNRIYGCDDCLAVCPWNRFAREGRLMRPHYRADLAAPDLLELLALDEAGFKARFAGTPMLRAKRRGLLRNVCVALGNVGDQAALPALERAARDPEPLLAEHAHWAMNQIHQRHA